jgi:predicted TIM-barrel fold metal-dependent hydrolase
MAVFANHAHVFPKDTKPQKEEDYFTEPGDVSSLLRLMDKCGIEKTVAFAPFFSQWEDRSGTPIDWLADEIRQHHDRICGYAALNPERADAIEMITKAKELGFQGIKLHPAYEHWSLKSPAAYAFYQKAEDLQMILDFHTGIHWHRISHYHPLIFDDIACDFPTLSMVFEHVGGFHFFHEMLSVLVNHNREENSRLFAGIASVLSSERQKYWYLGAEGIKTILWQLDDSCLIFGLDFPYNSTDDIAQDLKIIRSLDIPDRSKDKILGGNLKRLLSGKNR